MIDCWLVTCLYTVLALGKLIDWLYFSPKLLIGQRLRDIKSYLFHESFQRRITIAADRRSIDIDILSRVIWCLVMKLSLVMELSLIVSVFPLRISAKVSSNSYKVMAFYRYFFFTGMCLLIYIYLYPPICWRLYGTALEARLTLLRVEWKISSPKGLLSGLFSGRMVENTDYIIKHIQV